jgi:hypothetical protein
MTHKITITARGLRDLLAPVMPLADQKGWTLPILGAVRLRGHGDQLTATATDRYRLGICRAAIEAPAELDAVVPLATAKAILGMFKATRDFDPELVLEFNGDHLAPVVHVTTGGFGEIEGARVGFRLLAGEYPKVDAILAEAFTGDLVAGTATNAKFLGDFAAAVRQGEPLRLYSSGKPNRPIGVTVGDYFLGAIMPVRVASEDDVAALTPWSFMLGETTPKAVSA